MSLKVFGGVLVGIVIGAAAAEFVSKKNPELVKNVTEKVKNSLKAVGDAFKQGYSESVGEKELETAEA